MRFLTAWKLFIKFAENNNQVCAYAASLKSQMEQEYSRSFFISANECNPEGELSVTVLVTEIIEIATSHANHLHIGNPDMKEYGAGWVLSRLTIEMDHYPKADRKYRITTWVESWNRHFSLRDFCITDEDGEIYGYARSVWVVLNTETHQNFGTSHLHLPEGIISERECPIALQKKHATILPYGEKTPEGSKALEATSPADRYTFKYNDIDFYRHVNTVKYVGILLNQYSLEEFDRSFIRRLELSFLHEGKYGETILINRHDEESAEGNDNKVSSFTFTTESEGQEIIYARIKLGIRNL